MAGKVAQNSKKQHGRKPTPASWKPGESGNPGGRPKNEISLTHWVKEIGAMTSEGAANLCEQYARDFRQVKTGDVPLIGVVAIRIYQTIINDAPPGLTGQLWDRIDGTVETKVNTTGETTFKVVYEGEDDDRKL